jgi:hypothetical protein
MRDPGCGRILGPRGARDLAPAVGAAGTRSGSRPPATRRFPAGLRCLSAWPTTEAKILRSDIAAEIEALRREGSGEILAHARASLAQPLGRPDMVGESRLRIFPTRPEPGDRRSLSHRAGSPRSGVEHGVRSRNGRSRPVAGGADRRDHQRQQEIGRQVFEALESAGRWRVVYIDDMQKVLNSYQPDK